MYKLEDFKGVKELVVLFLIDTKHPEGPRVLLGLGAPHKKMGALQWNAPGGHVNIGEAPVRAMIRETKEEIGVDVEEGDILMGSFLHLRLMFRPAKSVLLHIGVTKKWKGEPDAAKCPEFSQIVWHPISDLPVDELIAGDRLWMEKVLYGAGVRGFVCHTDKSLRAVQSSDLEFYTGIECEKRRE